MNTFERISQILEIQAELNRHQAELTKELAKLLRQLQEENVHHEERFYSVKKTAEILDMGESTVRRLISQGELKAVRVGGKLLIPASALQTLAENQEV